MNTARTSQAGTVESMDCLVTITESGGGRVVEITGSSASRFRGAMEEKVNEVLDALDAQKTSMSCPAVPVKVSVQDNGAMDLVLGARVEAAYRRFMGGDAR